MHARGTFSIKNFTPSPLKPVPAIETGLPVGVSTMEKIYQGAIQGHSATLFTAAFDPSTRQGSYIAMESFSGTVDGIEGTFNFIHSASTTGSDRADAFFSIVKGSGTADLQHISGTGAIVIDADGAHFLDLDYQLQPA